MGNDLIMNFLSFFFSFIENLLEVRKKQLLSELEATGDEQTSLSSPAKSQSSEAKNMDAEYAAFKVSY